LLKGRNPKSEAPNPKQESYFFVFYVEFRALNFGFELPPRRERRAGENVA
jgi:hypothetical protein